MAFFDVYCRNNIESKTLNKNCKFQMVLIIPTYLKLWSPDEISKAEGILLLKRAVESLNLLENNEFTVFTPFCVDTHVWTDEFDLAIRKAVRNFSSKIPIVVFTENNMINLKKYFKEKGYSEIADRLSVCGYSNIRNCGLIVSNILNADIVIFIDNDEVIEDKDFLKTACEYLDTDYGGIKVNGKGGFYLSRNGEVVEKPTFYWWQLFWNKGRLISETTKGILDAKERLVKSPIVFGGNLVLYKNLFSKVPFDPLIPRGEDIDYLINSRRLGFNILFDRDLRIKHLHPERTLIFKKAELKGDIERFLYEREKVEGLNISLDPYPGYFLKKNLPIKAIATILLFAVDLLLKFKIADLIDVIGYKNLFYHKWNNVWQEYLKFQKDWEKLMNFITENRPNIISFIK